MTPLPAVVTCQGVSGCQAQAPLEVAAVATGWSVWLPAVEARHDTPARDFDALRYLCPADADAEGRLWPEAEAVVAPLLAGRRVFVLARTLARCRAAAHALRLPSHLARGPVMLLTDYAATRQQALPLDVDVFVRYGAVSQMALLYLERARAQSPGSHLLDFPEGTRL